VTIKHLAGTKAAKALLSLLVLALLAVTLQSLVFSSASYTKASANPGNAFTAGSLGHIDSKAGQIVLAATNLRPGQSSNGTLTITGTGTLTGTYSVTKVSLVDTPATPGLSKALTLLIQDVTGTATTLYNGTASAFTSATAGSIAPGVTKTYRFTLTYPATPVDPALQGASMALRLQFTGVTP
jgi:spore coat-associated protein N